MAPLAILMKASSRVVLAIPQSRMLNAFFRLMMVPNTLDRVTSVVGTSNTCVPATLWVHFAEGAIVLIICSSGPCMLLSLECVVSSTEEVFLASLIAAHKVRLDAGSRPVGL